MNNNIFRQFPWLKGVQESVQYLVDEGYIDEEGVVSLSNFINKVLKVGKEETLRIFRAHSDPVDALREFMDIQVVVEEEEPPLPARRLITSGRRRSMLKQTEQPKVLRTVVIFLVILVLGLAMVYVYFNFMHHPDSIQLPDTQGIVESEPQYQAPPPTPRDFNQVGLMFTPPRSVKRVFSDLLWILWGIALLRTAFLFRSERFATAERSDWRNLQISIIILLLSLGMKQEFSIFFNKILSFLFDKQITIQSDWIMAVGILIPPIIMFGASLTGKKDFSPFYTGLWLTGGILFWLYPKQMGSEMSILQNVALGMMITGLAIAFYEIFRSEQRAGAISVSIISIPLFFLFRFGFVKLLDLVQDLPSYQEAQRLSIILQWIYINRVEISSVLSWTIATSIAFSAASILVPQIQGMAQSEGGERLGRFFAVEQTPRIDSIIIVTMILQLIWLLVGHL